VSYLSYVSLTKYGIKKARKAFSKTMSQISGDIFASSIYFLSDVDSIKNLLKKVWGVWEICRAKPLWEVFAQGFMSKIIINLNREYSSYEIERKLKDLKDFIYKYDHLENLSILLLSLHVHRLDEKSFLAVLRAISIKFENDSSPEGIELKIFLSRILYNLPGQK
jgi:hypothetical protein